MHRALRSDRKSSDHLGGQELGGGLHGSCRHGGCQDSGVRRRQRDARVRAGTLDRFQHRPGKRRTVAVRRRRERPRDHEYVPDQQGNVPTIQNGF